MPPQNFSLIVPVDASQVDGIEAGQTVKVGVQLKDESILAKTIKLPASRKGEAKFEFSGQPGSMRVAIGPDNADDRELMGLQTINVSVSPRQWGRQTELSLPPVVVTQHYWRLWRRWCRTFTVHGKIVCPDGSPVPGARVCAYDVDWWWWWCSSQEVGCATTDHTGAFEIKFRHCCGWWPWWWWRTRHWHLEPRLAEQLMPVLEHRLGLKRLPRPSPRPDIEVFRRILGEELDPNDLGVPGSINRPIDSREPTEALAAIGRGLEPDRLEEIRQKLIERIPVVPELERMRLWPWWPWKPWSDCSPDLIFHATQDCDGESRVIVDETCWDTRWNVGTETDVTLVAPEACCISDCRDPQDCPDGDCVVISRACSIVVDQIGGNPGAPASPSGYVGPGNADRPFGGVVPIHGVFGSGADVDYYEFELSDDGGTTFNPMPSAASGSFIRRYWGPKVGTADPAGFHNVPFNFTDISGRRVVESREHFEANNDPASWGVTRFWALNFDRLMTFRTENVLADGAYELRLKSWKLVSGALEQETVLPLCDTDDDNGLVLRLDNRLVGPGSGHPASVPSHPCGPGTVHLCTLEPDTDILGVRIDGNSVDPCDIVRAADATTLEIDFRAHDPDGHLKWYSLRATYGENQLSNLLSQPSAILVPIGAAQVGPTYAAALAQGATSPVWAGGTYRLTVAVAEAFPESCAYQLELRAAKRTIYNCNGNDPIRNRSEYSFTVIV